MNKQSLQKILDSRPPTRLGMSVIEFFECGWILDIKWLSPVQKVILKSIMGEPLDTENEIPLDHSWMSEYPLFQRDKPFKNEVELFLFFTGKDEYEDRVYSDVDLLIGRRSGKTQVKGTTIQLADGSVEIVDKFIGQEINIIAWDKNKNTYTKTKANVVDNGVKPCSKIKTKYGHILERTNNHPLYTIEGWGSVDGSYSPDIGKLKELKVGDRIAVPINNPIEGQIPQDESFIKLLGYLLADGSLINKRITYTLYNKAQEEEILGLLENENIKIYPKKGTDAKDLKIPSDSKIANLCKELKLIGTRSDDKFIPNWVYRLPNDQVALFLNRLISTDGWCCVSTSGSKAKCEVGFSSASKKMTYGVKRLLSRLGIISNIFQSKAGYKNNKNEYIRCKDRYSVVISNNSEIVKFLERVGLYGKDEEIRKINDFLGPNSFNSQVDSMPLEFCQKFAKKLKGFLSYPKQEKLHGRVRPDRSTSKERLLKYANMFAEHFEDEIKTLNQDFYWDEIVEIEDLGNQPTAGLEVPVYHTYVNDVIEHNSTAIGAGLALYFATQFDYSPYLRTSPNATIPIISASKDQAGEVYNAIKQMILRSPYIFQKFLNGKVQGFEDEYDEKDIGDNAKFTGGIIKLNCKVHIKIMAADTGRLRGMAVPMAILDENCFFGTDASKDKKVTDIGIFEALRPAFSQFRKVKGMALMLKISSPNGQSGLMYNNYIKRKNKNVLHWQVPSWYANPDVPEDYLEEELEKGRQYFDREFGAQYTASESSYLDPERIDATIIKGAEEIEPTKGYKYVAAMDYATKGDYWTFGIGHKEYVNDWEDSENKSKKEIVQVDFLMHWKGSNGNELDPSEVIPTICNYMKKYGVSFCLTDQYAYAPLRVLFQREGCNLKEFKITRQSKLKMMMSLSVAVNSQSLKMVHKPLAIQHLKDLREKVNNGMIKIEHAQNCHDDYCLLPEAAVTTSEGYKYIKDIKVGDLVVTHKNRLRKVLKVSERAYKGTLGIVNSTGALPLKLTKNHKMFVNSGEWKNYTELNESDCLRSLTNYERKELNNSVFSVNSHLGKSEFKIDNEISLLLGYFLGDGWAEKQHKYIGSSSYRFNFAVAKKDRHIKHFIQKVFNKYDVKINCIDKGGCWVLTGHSKLFHKLFHSCYDKNREKIIPKQAFKYSFNKKLVVFGWLLADGSKTNKNHIGVTTSKKLALGMKDFALESGVYATMRKVKRKRYFKETKDQYWVSITFKRYTGDKKCKVKENQMFHKVRKLEEKPYEGFVYNLEVEEDNSYVANGLVVHNCDVIAEIVYQFDKNSPVYVGSYKEEEITTEINTKDKKGKHIAYPTASELASFAGNQKFSDNRAEIEAQEKENDDPDDELEGDGGFFWSF